MSSIQSMGGKARAAAMSPEARREVAIKAARARWDGHIPIVRSVPSNKRDRAMVLLARAKAYEKCSGLLADIWTSDALERREGERLSIRLLRRSVEFLERAKRLL